MIRKCATLCFVAGALALTAGAVAPANPTGLLPDGPDVVISVSLDQLRGRPKFQEEFDGFLQAIGAGSVERFKEFQTRTGVDPSKDVEAVAVGVYLPAQGTTGAAMPTVVSVIQGKYDQAKLTEGLRWFRQQSGVTVQQEQFDGVPLFTEGNAGQQAFLAVPSATAMVASNSRTHMERAITAAKATRTLPLPRRLATLMEKTSDQALIRGVGRVPSAGGETQQIVRQVQDFLFEIRATQGLQFKAELTFADAQSASMARNQITAMIGFAGLALAGNGQMTADEITRVNQILGKLNTATSEATMTMNFQISEAEMQALTQLAQKMR